MASFIEEKLELIKRVGSSSNSKKIVKAYFKLPDNYYEVINSVKGIKNQFAFQKKSSMQSKGQRVYPVETAVKIFNISWTTYHNYKTLVINKCDASCFL